MPFRLLEGAGFQNKGTCHKQPPSVPIYVVVSSRQAVTTQCTLFFHSFIGHTLQFLSGVQCKPYWVHQLLPIIY